MELIDKKIAVNISIRAASESVFLVSRFSLFNIYIDRHMITFIDFK